MVRIVAPDRDRDRRANFPHPEVLARRASLEGRTTPAHHPIAEIMARLFAAALVDRSEQAPRRSSPLSIEKKFTRLGTVDAPGQEIRRQSSAMRALLRGDALPG